MRPSRPSLAAAVYIVLAAAVSVYAVAQSPIPKVTITRTPVTPSSKDTNGEPTKDDVEIVSFSEPKYPPLAATASVTGDVVLKLGIRKDGSVSSVAVMSGNKMLTDAAIASAQSSKYECRGCADGITETPLVYSFRQEMADGWPCSGLKGARVTRLRDRITVTVEPRMVYLVFGNTTVPAAKCLYLWNCGSHSDGDDYYYDKVRSGKCLNLWNCGRQLREPWATCKKLHRDIT